MGWFFWQGTKTQPFVLWRLTLNQQQDPNLADTTVPRWWHLNEKLGPAFIIHLNVHFDKFLSSSPLDFKIIVLWSDFAIAQRET